VRKAFVETLCELASRDERVLLLTGDLGYMALEPFIEANPRRFFNMGVAEQNMIGVATGLAAAGFLPFCYSIANFSVLRPLEFIRNGPVLHELPVRIVGMGAGFEYGTAGPTHHVVDDVGVLRTQQNLMVVTPADPAQTRQALRKTFDLPGPVYYRLGKDDKTCVPGLDGRFDPVEIQKVRKGSNALILASGAIVLEALGAAQILSEEGIECTVALVPVLSPPPVESLILELERHLLVFTLEAHVIQGGLGSIVCEICAENGLHCRVTRCAVRHPLGGLSGGQSFHHDHHGLSRQHVAGLIREAIGHAQ